MAKDKNLYVYGYHTVRAALERKPELQRVLFVQEKAQKAKKDERLETIVALAQRAGVSLQYCDKSVLDRLSEGGLHQGVVSQGRPIVPHDQSQLLLAAQEKLDNPSQGWPCYLVLENVTDPHNLGACLRTCAAMGVAGVIVARHDRPSLNATVLKVSSGGGFVTPVYEVANIVRAIKPMQSLGYWAVATALHDSAQSLFDLSLTGPLLCVMGSEGQGLKRLTLEACDYCAKIPMTDAVGSLNVSVAVGMVISEAWRQRAC